jgi:hypothetical protein
LSKNGVFERNKPLLKGKPEKDGLANNFFLSDDVPAAGTS